MLIQTGWQDLFVRQSFQQYERLAGRGVEVGLTVGPWGHGAGTGRIQFNETLEWLEQHLRGGDLRARSAPVRMFVTGADQWRDVASWPPPTRAYVLYPWPGRTLETKAVESPSRVSFTYDPADPTPSIGGPALTDGGYRDDAALASRPDVVTFTTEALRVPLEVIGRPIVELAHRTDNVHADLFVRLSEIGADDRSQNISDGFLRLEPARSTTLIGRAVQSTDVPSACSVRGFPRARGGRGDALLSPRASSISSEKQPFHCEMHSRSELFSMSFYCNDLAD